MYLIDDRLCATLLRFVRAIIGGFVCMCLCSVLWAGVLLFERVRSWIIGVGVGSGACGCDEWA